MMAPTHMATGAAFGLAATATFHAIGHPLSLSHLVVSVAVSTGAALFPDIDHKSSRISKTFGIVTLGLAILMRGLSHRVYEWTRGEKDPPRSGRHRGLTHTPIGALACGLLTAALILAVARWVPPLLDGWRAPAIGPRLPTLVAHGLRAAGGWWWLGAPVFLGCIAHQAGDWLTEQGIPLLWPLKRHGSRWHHYRFIWPVSTNHAGEHFIWMPIFLAMAASGAYFTLI